MLDIKPGLFMSNSDLLIEFNLLHKAQEYVKIKLEVFLQRKTRRKTNEFCSN